MENSEKHSFWESPIKIVLLTYLEFLLISYTCNIAHTIGLSFADQYGISITLIQGLLTLVQVVALQSSFYLFSYNNPIKEQAFYQNNVSEYSFSSNFKALIQSLEYWVAVGFFTLLLAFVPNSLSWLHFDEFFQAILPNVTTFAVLALRFAFSFLASSSMLMVAKMTSIQNWILKRGPSNKKKKTGIVSLIISCLVNCIVYLISCAVIPLMIPFITSIFSTTSIFRPYIIPILLWIVGIIFLIQLLYYIRGIKSRVSFFRKLESLQKNHILEIKEVQWKVFPVFHVKTPYNIVIEAHGYVFDLLVLTPKKRRFSMEFRKDGYGYYKKPFMFINKGSYSISKQFYYQHETTHNKVIILTRSPNTITVEENEIPREISIGDCFFDVQVFSPEIFYGCIERNSLNHKKESKV